MTFRRHFLIICKYTLCCVFLVSTIFSFSFTFAETLPINTVSTESIADQSITSDGNCNYLQSSLKIGAVNNPSEVKKLQQFLLEREGFQNVVVTRVFDQLTLNAVLAFQIKYSAEILKPWGYTEPTGFVYLLTKKKINELVCGAKILLTDAENQEINTYRTAFVASVSSASNVTNVTKTKAVAPTVIKANVVKTPQPAKSELKKISPNIFSATTSSALDSVPLLTSNDVVVNRKIFDAFSSFTGDEKTKGFVERVFSVPHGDDAFGAIVLFVVVILILNVISTYIGRRTQVFLVGSVLAVLYASLFNREYLVIPFFIIFLIFGSLFLRKIFTNEKEKTTQEKPTQIPSSIPSSLLIPMHASAPMFDAVSEEEFVPEFSSEDDHTLSQMLEQEQVDLASKTD